MKSKGFTYLLIVIVAAVWYQVFFRIKSNLIGEDVVLPANSVQLMNLKSTVRDTFTLNANYRDPFEGITEHETAVVNPSMPIIPFQPVYVAPRIKPIHQWPKIKYYGLMKKSDSKKPLCIVNFDDMLLNLREGDFCYDEYMIKSIYKDSVVIVHKGLRRTFLKNKN